MFNRGATKIIVALLPAIAAFVLSLLTVKTNSFDIIIPIVLGLLLLGGILTASILTKNLRKTSGLFVTSLLYILLVVGYVGIFGFTGCLGLVALGNI